MAQTFDIGALGQGAAAQGIGAIMGMGIGAYNDNRQEIQNRRLMHQQVGMQKELTDYNTSKQLEMWKATSYPAQMEQLKKAGLNPGLLYGMGGGGGQTANIAQGNVEGAKAQQNPGEIQAMAGMGIQAGMMKAQQELMAAQAKNLDADTKNKEGVIPANIQADTGLKIAQTGNTQIDTKIKDIQAEIQKATTEEQIMTLTMQAEKWKEEVMQMAIKTNIDRTTMNKVIDGISAEMAGKELENTLLKAQTNLTDEQRKQIGQTIQQKWAEIAQGWQGLDQQAKAMKVDALIKEVEQMYKSPLGRWTVPHDPYKTAEQIDKIWGLQKKQ